MAKPDDKTKPEIAGEKNEGDLVTYLAGEGDPPKTKWRGIIFYANVPKKITDPDHIAAARGNKGFHVGPFDPDTDRIKTELEQRPKTSEQYRAHAAEWLKRMHSVDELDTKWASEETLRMECGVGTDDIDWLQHLIAPKRSELKKAGLPA